MGFLLARTDLIFPLYSGPASPLPEDTCDLHLFARIGSNSPFSREGLVGSQEKGIGSPPAGAGNPTRAWKIFFLSRPSSFLLPPPPLEIIQPPSM